MTKQGERRCICQADHKWNGLILNCSLSSELGTQGSFIAKLTSSQNQRTLVISISVVLGVITLCSISYIVYQNTRVARSREARDIVLGNHMENFPRRESFGEELITADEKRHIDVPFFSLNSILEATDNFSNAAKLGQGGFGPVYKGKFLEGAELAVKRLSNHSGQGVEEFKTEVMLIAKLQHRNLVRLLGYCVEGNEKILVYEYMANKSLDTFIFNRTFCRLLDWRIRFEIILGIARGLLYLHQDSRLRIIHRDLKTSNILLDDEMNAKISDFGLARIIEGKSTEANTTRVVGTYGYMSPEYALEGLFSIKSDIFAFGVVVLEIISGKRNMEFFEEVNLTGYAWRLWMEDRALDMMDQTIVDTFEDKEVIKCVNVALLCVQEDPGDRPTMSNVVVMLGGESMTLPRPSQPHFITRRNALSTSSSSSKLYSTFNKELAITHEEEGQYIEIKYKIIVVNSKCGESIHDSNNVVFPPWYNCPFRNRFRPMPALSHLLTKSMSIENKESATFCNCLTGFTPKSDTEWDLNDHSGGCVRKESLQCGDGKMKGGFSVNPNVTLPGYSLTVPAAECQSTCLSNCSSCNAYAYDNNLLSPGDGSGNVIYTRVAFSDEACGEDAKSGKLSPKLKVIISGVVAVAVLLLCSFSYIYHRRILSKNTANKAQEAIQCHIGLNREREAQNLINENDKQNIAVPFFSLENILAATDNFSDRNKLGQGGFGPVYKVSINNSLQHEFNSMKSFHSILVC
uniref:non-specific serine/threonine protein kinase n=1 Tax=Solanum lycopersicum TaxID=4081 RepID=A0A3Q7HEV3_SOLLC